MKSINSSYIIVTFVAVILAVGILFLPQKKIKTEIAPEALLLEVIDDTRYISVDELAQKLVEENPFIQLIDVRTAEEYNTFSLPGAVNIPLSEILKKDSTGFYIYEGYLNGNNITNVLFSNGSIYSSQAWMLCRRNAFNNNYILKGGLNEWTEKILLNELPLQSADNQQHDIYKFRKAAKTFFTGENSVSTNSSEQRKAAPVKKAGKKKNEAGGC